MDVVVTPQTTYILIEQIQDSWGIYTDAPSFPSDMDDDPPFSGYSIGKWLDEDVTAATTPLRSRRGMKGPRVFDATGIPGTTTTRPSSRSASTSMHVMLSVVRRWSDRKGRLSTSGSERNSPRRAYCGMIGVFIPPPARFAACPCL
jgi:hypothetical protein